MHDKGMPFYASHFFPGRSMRAFARMAKSEGVEASGGSSYHAQNVDDERIGDRAKIGAAAEKLLAHDTCNCAKLGRRRDLDLGYLVFEIAKLKADLFSELPCDGC